MTSGAGLTVERRFTTAGVHPFDEVVWEKRSAVIGNEKGVTVFEQHDVEIPASWSQMATNVVVSKYFRGPLNTPRRETSVKQVISRVCDTIADWGREGGYFATEDDARAFQDELTHLVLHQKMAFNSPVWFNVGVPGTRPQASACFINSVEDTMESILTLAKTEGMLFKYGSGTGTNLSPLRSSNEQLGGGGTASGPVSFMKGFDAFAGVIKSGGTTRRAAKMVILNVDHPDVREFITCKVSEERKAWALIEAGYDPSFTGEAYASVFFQNSNNSVRVTDEFMRAVIDDKEWHLRAVVDPERIVATIPARQLMRLMAESAWQCGDPGIQYDTTINDWHTSANSGRINASNPCFPGDARVHTTAGLLPISELYTRMRDDEDIRVYTHRATAETPAAGVVATRPLALMQTGVKPIVRLTFSDGRELRCTANHRLWTTNRGWVHAEDLAKSDLVMLNDTPTPAEDAAWALPVKVEAMALSGSRAGTKVRHSVPERWSTGLGELTGHLVGDGCMTSQQTVWVYGGDDVADGMVERHAELLTDLFGGISQARMQNGTVQLRVGSSAIRELFAGLGASPARAHQKRVPESIFHAPSEVQVAFLRGLFGADGRVCAVEGAKKSRYVGLGSRSRELLAGVQTLLSGFGISARLYDVSSISPNPFTRRRNGGETATYAVRPAYDLRLTGASMRAFAERVGFATPRKQRQLEELLAVSRTCASKTAVRVVSSVGDGSEMVYNLTEPLHHSYIVDGVVVANCSEYMYLDDSACNLASLNLMKFLNEDGSFDVGAYRHAVHVTITAQEILVGNAAYPTDRIGKNSEDFRPLGLGYANLGALLMARGVPYDSPQGRDLASCVTAVMTGEAYAQSARIAREVGPFNGYAVNRQPMLRVIAKHREAAYNIGTENVEVEMVTAARRAWDEAHELGAKHGYRNGQATVLAPTGCLVGDSLVLTNRGLRRIRSLGNPNGAKWQDVDLEVASDEGPQRATRFFVNGLEPVVSVETSRGYRIQGTTMHRIKVVDAGGAWVWRRFADVRPGDRVPLLRSGLVGEPNAVPLPPLGERYWTEDHGARVPSIVTAELAELVGYFMGDGSLHSKGIRLCIADTDPDLADRLAGVGERLFGLSAARTQKRGYVELAFHSQRLVQWWQACGFAKLDTDASRRGKGLTANIPEALLATNSAEIYGAFVRGLFEADGTVSSGYVSFTTISRSFSQDVQALLLALGFVTTRKVNAAGGGWSTHDRYVLRLLNQADAARFAAEIGFGSARKQALCNGGSHPQAARHDQIPVSRELVTRLTASVDDLRSTMLTSLRRSGTVSRRSATALLERTADPELQQALCFFYDDVVSAELGTEEMTYDLSVPTNVTYVANGFVSHNTIGFMMDCDTTGVEPDIALVKYKKLVGGGMLKIVNQTVPLALQRLGYGDSAVSEIGAYIDANDTIEGAPSLRDEDIAVFDCAFTPQNGKRSIAWQGHVRMMSAVQPFLSGAISKTVNMPNEATVDDIEQAYIDGWKLGLKALAIYRDGSKRSQPMATSIGKTTGEKVQIVERPLRKRLPAERAALTHRFEVGGHEGYITVGLYDDGQPGEIFLKMAKEGSTVSGLMDAFATAVSLALQYGVPLQALVDKLSHTRFDPQGFTKNPEVPIAKSLMDYIFRWMASRFMSQEDRDRLGIIRRDDDGDAPSAATAAIAAAAAHATPVASAVSGVSGPAAAPGITPLAMEGGNSVGAFANQGDAPSCSECGSLMVRSGACYKCHNCGATSGCS
ncbi:MAG: LAGLIDADG family homing endonuclease [Candidatus Dormibacteria bacterium]